MEMYSTPETAGEVRPRRRPAEDGVELVFDLYRGSRRVAWGLRDREAGQRWALRLGGGVHLAGDARATQPA